MASYATTIQVDGKSVVTLSDILPDPPGLKALFVAKTPAPKSVATGHYFQGRQGRMFWNRLIEYRILHPTTAYEDESLLDHGYGITDIVKVPRHFGNEPSEEEYRAGLDRILTLIRTHHPRVVVFVYKRVLDQVLRLGFQLHSKSSYGFNPQLDARFDCRVFVFPMPGTPCKTDEALAAMAELARELSATLA
jgi:G:T/U-mismatch repair DNA glycosylase